MPSLLDGRGDALVGGFPIGAGAGEKVGEREGGAASVGPVKDGDGLVGERGAVVDGANAGVVPAGDFAEVDGGEDLGSEAEVAAAFGEVVGGDDTAEDGGEVVEGGVLGGHLLVGDEDVGAGEVDGAGLEEVDTLFRPDALVGNVQAGALRFEVLDPLLVERRGEGGSGTSEGDLWGGGGGIRGASQAILCEDRGEEPDDVLGHVLLDAVPVEAAGSDHVGPEGLAVGVLEVESEIAAVDGLAGTAAGAERDVALDPGLAVALNDGVGVFCVVDELEAGSGLEPVKDVGVERAGAGAVGE